MNEEREKSISEKKLEKVLGINDKLRKLDDEEEKEIVNGDNDKKRRIEERKEYLQEIKGNYEKLKVKGDKEFARDVYRELIEIDVEMLRITRKEMEIDPSPRHIETAGTLTNAITATLDSLRDIEIVETEQELEREKIDIKKNSNANGTTNTSVVMMGGFTDIMDKIALMQKEKLINIEQVKELEKK